MFRKHRHQRKPAKARIIGALAGMIWTMPSWAACTSPAGEQGDLIFNTSANTVQFCDGSSWWDTRAGDPLSHVICSNGQVVEYNSALSAWSCRDGGTTNASDLNAGLLAINLGGTAVGSTPANGQTLIGNGAGYNVASISGVNGISVTNGAGTIGLSLSNTLIAGSGSLVAYNSQGLINNSSNLSVALTGDVTSSTTILSANTSIAASLSNTGVAANTYGASNAMPQVTINSGGRLTNAGTAAVSVPASTITSGLLPVSSGGTSTGSLTSGGVLIGSGTSAIISLVGAANGHVLTWNSTTSTWESAEPPAGEDFSPSSPAAMSIDFAIKRSAATSQNCGDFTLTNMEDGKTYVLIVRGTVAGNCSFTHSGAVVRPGEVASPTTGNKSKAFASTSGKQTVFAFIRAGNDIYVTFAGDQ